MAIKVEEREGESRSGPDEVAGNMNMKKNARAPDGGCGSLDDLAERSTKMRAAQDVQKLVGAIGFFAQAPGFELEASLRVPTVEKG